MSFTKPTKAAKPNKLIQVGGSAVFNAVIAAVAQYHPRKGVAVTAKNGSTIVYVPEKDSKKGIALMKEVTDKVFEAHSDHDFIRLNDNAFISVGEIGAITIVPKKAVVINNNEGDILYWLKESNEAKAELIYAEIFKAYETVGDDNPYVIDWPALMATPT